MLHGLFQHFLLTLRLNFRSGRAIAYGYLMPVIFLLGFGSVFRSGEPLLLGQMGQILTITILGGACLGMPTALVAERERGVWRRYQLLPVATGALVSGVLLVRVVLVAGAVLLQLGLARLVYGTPWPMHWAQFGGAFLLAMFAFLGLGLVVTALAPDVPAVQALGQCLFLPMILIGGVGVPLVALPEWAQRAAAFMPGRYAVDALQTTISNPRGLVDAQFSLLALAVIGGAALLAGAKLQRWDAGRRLTAGSRRWIAAALSGWVIIGALAFATDHVAPGWPDGGESFDAITDAQIAAITYDQLPSDDGFYAPLAPPFNNRRLPHRLQEFIPRLQAWGPGHRPDPAQSVRNLLSVVAIADFTQDHAEREIARAVFEHLREKYDPRTLQRALAWVILQPQAGRVITNAPELGLRAAADEGIVRERSDWYARKFLGRLRGQIPDETGSAP